tara:strand:- start:538 stop:843 length:306 start_codon:yes stop_codon:yes gene_type:complete
MFENLGNYVETSILNTLQIIQIEETMMIKKTVIALLADEIDFDPAEISGNTSLSDDLDLRTDELESVMALIEDEFDIVVSELDYYEFETVNDIINHVRQKI